MLKLVKIHSKSQIWEYFKNIDIERDAWIVSRSSEREILSEKIMSSHGYFLDMSVQLTRPFFQNIHKTLFPDFTIVSREFAHAFLKRKMEILKLELALDVVDEKSRLRSISYFAPLLLDPDLDEEKLQEWLELSEERKLRLKPDLLINELFLTFFTDNKMICEDWILAHLQTADFSDITFPISRFFFDLGADYTIVEASILQKLGKNYEVTIFQTVHKFDSDYGHLLQAYERFDLLDNRSQGSEASASIELKKFSSAVSESRYAVAQIKQWLDQGARPNQLAIVAPDIEQYQDILSWQLLAENISTNQNKKSGFLQFQDVRELLSDLSFYKSEIEYTSIRESLIRYYANKRGSEFNRLEEKLNSQYLSADQLLKLIHSLDARFFSDRLDLSVEKIQQLRSVEMNVVEFLKATQLFWERNQLSERKEKIINSIYNSTSLAIKLSLEEWVEQVARSALQAHVTLGSQKSEGITVTSLSKLSLYQLKNVVIIGLDENGFKNNFKESIPPDDIFNLGSELGVYLAHPDLNLNAYLLEDLLSQVSGTAVMSYPYKAIDSSIQNPAAQWQTRAFHQKLFEKELDTPKTISWDSVINHKTSGWFQIRKQESKLEVLSWDQQPALTKPLLTFFLNEISLSPSSIQTFLDCRQKFFFQRVLKLRSVESETFDVNARGKGSWFHSIFEKIIASENEYIVPLMNTELTDATKASLISKLIADFGDIHPHGFSSNTWKLVKKSYFEKVVKFFSHEIEMRKSFPEIKSLKVEWPWEVFYDYETHEFSKSSSNNSIKIAGVIDRILLNQKTKQLWLIDYKSSLTNYSTFEKWIGKQEFQLLLYNHIVQNVSGEPWAAPVEYLSYWQLPGMKSKKGFTIADPRFLDFGHSKKNLGTLEEKTKLEAEFLVQFKEIINQMKLGHFYPTPNDEKICTYCEWRLACRAPHL